MEGTMNLSEITDGELLIMKCLWDEDHPLSAEEIIDALKFRFQKESKGSTVYTFLSRLKDKGYVDSYKKGASYYFYLVSQEDFLKKYSQTLSDFWDEKGRKQLLAAFIQRQNYSEQKRKRIQESIDDLD